MGRQSVQNVVDSFSDRIFPGLSDIPQDFSFVSGQSDIGNFNSSQIIQVLSIASRTFCLTFDCFMEYSL